MSLPKVAHPVLTLTIRRGTFLATWGSLVKSGLVSEEVYVVQGCPSSPVECLRRRCGVGAFVWRECLLGRGCLPEAWVLGVAWVLSCGVGALEWGLLEWWT